MITCSTCGISKGDEFYDPGRRQCRQCRTKKIAAWRKANPDRAQRNVAAANRSVTGRHSQLVYSARQRGIECNLLVDEYEEIIQSGTCSYCGDAISATGHALAMIDANHGYRAGNVVAACTDCNALWMFTHAEKKKHIGPAIRKVKGERR